MEHFKVNSIHCTDIWEKAAQYPDVTVNDNGDTFVVWQKYLDHVEQIVFAKIENREVIDPIVISGKGLALRPSMHTFNETVYIAWSEFYDEKWHLCVRDYKDGTFGGIKVVESGEALFYPSMKDDGENPVVVYNRQGVGFSEVVLATIGFDISKEVVSKSKKSYRPSFDHDDKGNYYVTYDRYNGENYDVVVRAKVDGQWSDEVKISESKNNCTHPVMVNCKDKVTIVWYENGSLCYFNNSAIDVYVENGEVKCSPITILVENANWYNNIDLTVNKKGIVVCTYTWGKYNAIIKIRENDIWSEPIVVTFNDGHCAVRPKVALDNNNVLHYVWQFANRNGHEHRYSSIIYNNVSLDEARKFYDYEIEKQVDQFIQPIITDKKLDFHDNETVRAWLNKNGYDNLELKFGDIHGQSNLSDGLGEIDQYYHFAIDGAKMDFSALTDHDNYPDIATDSEWEWNRTTRNLFNGEDDFAVLLAYEWTSNEYSHDFGHKNVYYPSSKGGMYRSTEPSGNTPYRLFESIKKDGGQCIPHHPAADWGLVSAATDWDYVDDEAQRLVEIFSRHADFEKYENTSRFTKNIKKMKRRCVQDALARNIRLGIVAGSDSHQMEHGLEGGIMAAYVPSLTSENVFTAMYDRFVYGTTGARILLSFKINGHNMGEELLVLNNQKVIGEVSVLALDKIKSVIVFKNNEVFIEKSVDSNEIDFTFEDTDRKETDTYYVRVEQVDDHRAWSSPIWVDSK